MVKIRRIEPYEWMTAKQVFCRVAHVTFEIPRPLDEFIATLESRGDLKDLDDIQKHYFDNGGTFLVIETEDRIVGMGAIRQLEDKVCELRRISLLFEYQGRGWGYKMVMELLRNARELGYEKIRLETAPVHQKRALVLYKRLGFFEIPKYRSTHPNDIAMEMVL